MPGVWSLLSVCRCGKRNTDGRRGEGAGVTMLHFVYLR